MKPRLMAQYSVEASLDNVALLLIRDWWLDSSNTSALGELDEDYVLMIADVQSLVGMDFSPLRKHRVGF